MRWNALFAAALALSLTAQTSEVPQTAPADPISDTQKIAGTWIGKVKSSKNAPVPLTLTMLTADLGQKVGAIVYGAPYICANALELASDDPPTLSVTVISGNGPHCDNSLNAQVELTLKSATELGFVLWNVDHSAVLHETTLTRRAPAPSQPLPARKSTVPVPQPKPNTDQTQ